MLIGCVGCAPKPGPWTSRATFTVRNAPAGARSSLIGTYTASASTVPYGDNGNAELYQGLEPSPNAVMDFGVTIGANPETSSNLSQFSFFVPALRGVGSYELTFADRDEDVAVRVDDLWSGVTNEWSMNSNAASCAVTVTSDKAMRNTTIRKISGSISCHGLYDANLHTDTVELTGRFDVFAQIWCSSTSPNQQVAPCIPEPPILDNDTQ